MASLAYVSDIKTDNCLSKLLSIVSPANGRAKFGTVLNYRYHFIMIDRFAFPEPLRRAQNRMPWLLSYHQQSEV